MNHHVTILAKNPFTTQVKTRLAKDIGADAARGVYARLLYQTLNRLTSSRSKINLTLCLPSQNDRRFFEEAYPELEITQQASGDLGMKIHDALQSAFKTGAQTAIVIGSDLPAMGWNLLDQAFNQIQENAVLLGPSLDGGYYLIGMQAPGINIFKDVPWSSARVLMMTIEKIRAAGFQPILLPEHQDIDFASDLVEWQADLNQKRNHWNQREKR